MNDEKEKYIHVCGRGGLGFALWLQDKLGGNKKCILVDCSEEYKLVRLAWKQHLKNRIIQSEKWVTNFQKFKKVVFYHEQEEWFTDCYSGVCFCFISRRDDFPYINAIVLKMTQGKLCLMEHTLIPQLKKGEKIYVLSIYNGEVMSENYISRYAPAEGTEDELSYSYILKMGTYFWHK